ncbi:spexin prohormone 1-like [Menidia menidia]
MSLSVSVTLLVVSLLSQGWAAPQRRHWTPQAILYLKGAQGHRSVLERSSREDGDTLHLVNYNQISDARVSSLAAFIFWELLLRAVEESGGGLDDYPDHQQLNLDRL